MTELAWHTVEVEHLSEEPWTWWPGRHRMPAHLIELNDRIWGPGVWVKCSRCLDSFGHPSYHHRDAHR